MTTVTVEVTQDDINKGQRKNPHCCPIALALKRRFHRECFVNAEGIDIYSRRNPNHVIAELVETEAMIDFMDRFDAGKDVLPEEFEFIFYLAIILR